MSRRAIPGDPPTAAALEAAIDRASGALDRRANPARNLPADLAALDRRLREWSASDASYALIDRYDLGDTWFSGGCLSLARALARWAGPEARVATVVDRSGAGMHWVASVGGWLLDGDGVTRPDAMRRRWQVREGIRGAAVRDDFVRPAADEEAMLCPVGAVWAIGEAVRGALGPPDAYPSLPALGVVENPPRRKAMSDTELMDLFLAERARFAAVYPAVAEASLDVSDDACNGDGPCRARDVAYCTWASNGRGPKRHQRVVILRRALSLPRDNLTAVVRHELGHLCDPRAGDPGPGAEARADRIAAEVGGQPIRYDAIDLQTVGPGKSERPAYLHQ